MTARRCQTGAKLAAVDGSVCSGCYALRIENIRPTVAKGWLANYLRATTMIETNADAWVRACVFQINKAFEKTGEPYHRWFDSGDLQSIAMLRAIVRVAELTPNIKHWLPTREATIVRNWQRAGGVRPANLIIRISSTMIGDTPRNAEHTSTVHRKGKEYHGNKCEAYTRGGQCGDCRACWDDTVKNVSYPKH
jgi:hypothetical protein